MNTSESKRPVRGLSACGLATLLLGTSLAVAKGYDIAIETVDMKAEPVEQALPEFPTKDVKKRQEGWVEVNFVVSPDGKAVDPIVTRSVGGDAFEKSAIEAIKSWRFVPADGESGSNTVQMRFENSKDSGKASRKFTQYYRMILTDLASEKVLKARISLDRARRAGGWNLYESTILDIVEAKVAEAEGDATGRLAALRRALHLGNEAALTVKTRREILRGMIQVETSLRQYASARESLAELQLILELGQRFGTALDGLQLCQRLLGRCVLAQRGFHLDHAAQNLAASLHGQCRFIAQVQSPTQCRESSGGIAFRFGDLRFDNVEDGRLVEIPTAHPACAVEIDARFQGLVAGKVRQDHAVVLRELA